MAKGTFDANIRESMKPKTPPQVAKADGASRDQAATGSEMPAPMHPQVPENLPPHLAAAASIAHAIINNRPAKGGGGGQGVG